MVWINVLKNPLLLVSSALLPINKSIHWWIKAISQSVHQSDTQMVYSPDNPAIYKNGQLVNQWVKKAGSQLVSYTVI